jgi:ABC-2 type transport system ATP-binding protein
VVEGSEAAVEVERLRVTRGGTLVLPSLTATVSRGRVTGLLGPSGSGKSTLLRAIVGVQRIDSGSVRVLGQDAGTPALRRTIAYRPQAPSVYGDLTVGENLRYFGRIHGAGTDVQRRVLETVGLERNMRRVVHGLSGGEQARVSLAIALVGNPELLVLDEPTVGLDPLLRRELWAMFRDLASAGATLLISSHVMDEADHCDELLLLREGRIIATGTPAELRARTGTADLSEAFVRLIEAVPA